MKAVYLVCVFNQEKVLVGAFSVIVQLHRLIDLRHDTQNYRERRIDSEECNVDLSVAARDGLGQRVEVGEVSDCEVGPDLVIAIVLFMI